MIRGKPRVTRAVVPWFLLLAVGIGACADALPPGAEAPPTTRDPTDVANLAIPSVLATPGSVASPANTVTSTSAPASAPPKGAPTISMTCFAFTANDLTVKTGTTTLFLRNDSDEICGERHDLVIGTDFDHPLATSDWISRDQAELFSVSGLPPGNYVFWCSVGLHRGLGMTGTLTVTR